MIWRFVGRRRFYQSLCAGACSGSHLREVLGRFRKSRQREIPDGNSTASVATEASAADIFAGMIMDGGPTFAEFERSALSEGHAIMARAMRRTLEHLDAALCAKTDGGGRRPRRRRALHQRMPERPATCCVRPGDQARRLDRGRRGVRLGRRSLVWRSRALPPPGGTRQGGGEGGGGLLVFGNRNIDTWGELLCHIHLLRQVGVEPQGRPREHMRHGCSRAPGDFWPEAVTATRLRVRPLGALRVHLGTDGEGRKRGGTCFPLRVWRSPAHIN